MAGEGDDRARRTATVTVLFCDLVGSTERQSRLGDEAADEFRRTFFGALTDVVTETGGELVKNTGDGVMAVYRASAVDAVTAASRMHDRVETLDADDPPRLRAGVSAGETAIEHGDWFGTPVVEAARLCAAADAGQTLVTEVVRSLVGSRGGHQFRSVGSLTLKGLPAPLPTAAVIRTPVAAPIVTSSRRRRRLWPAIAAAIVVVAFGVAVALLVQNRSDTNPRAPAASGYTPRFIAATCDRGLREIAPGGTCGVLVVPENRELPKGRQLKLPVWRIPARASGARASDPTIDVGAYGFLEDPVKSPALDHSELILFGTRVSDAQNRAMACPEFHPVAAKLLSGPMRSPATVARGRVALKRCAARLTSSGVDLTRYTFPDAGDDVVDLIRSLHFDRVNLVAQDRDIEAAFAAARGAPDAVRTLTLENPVAAGYGGASDPVGEISRAFDHYVALCREQQTCADAYPDLAATVQRNDRAYDLHPKTYTVDSFGQRSRVYLDGEHSVQAIANSLVDRGALGLLAAGIANPPPQLVAELAAANDYPWVSPDFPWASFLSKSCTDNNEGFGAAQELSRRTRREFAGIDDGTLQWECKAWPTQRQSDPGSGDFVGPIPTLIVQGELAWRATPQGTAHIQSGLSHSSLLMFSTLGTGTGGAGLLADGVPPCLNDLRRAFLTDPPHPLQTAACAGQSPRIDFVTATP